MVQETVEIKFTGSSTTLQNALNGIASAMQRTKNQGNTLNRATKTLNTTVRELGTSMRMVGGHLNGVIGRYVTLYALTRTGIGLFRRAFFAVESYNSQVIQTAALWTSFSKQLSATPIAEVFDEAIIKSEKLHQLFIDRNDQTLATVEQMGIINRELAKQGIVLDATNKKQIDAFKNLTNTIAILTAGMANVNIQFGQEIRAVLEGMARQGTTLSLVLKAKLGKAWKDITAQWKKDGVLVEKLAEQFRGVDAASIKLRGTWTLVGTSFKSLFDTILRLGMEDVFKDIINAVAALNTHLKENREELARVSREGFNRIASAIKRLLGVSGLKTLEENIAAVTFRLKGLFLIVGSAALISALGNLVLSFSNLFSVLKLIAGLQFWPMFIAFASNPAVLGFAAVLSGIALAAVGVKAAVDDWKETTERSVKLNEAFKDLKTTIDDIDVSKLSKIAVPKVDVQTGEIEFPDIEETDIDVPDFEPELTTEGATEFWKEMGEELIPKSVAAMKEWEEAQKTAHERAKAVGEAEKERQVQQAEAIEKLTKVYLRHHQEITNSFLSSIDTWAQGGQSFQELWGNLAQNMADIYRKRFFKPFASMLASLAQLAVDFALSLFDSKKREALASAVMSAHEGAAAAFANAGGFPLGIPAYAATLAKGLAEAAAIQATSFDVGTMNVPTDMPANVHRGEIIIPRTFSEGIRQGKATLGSSEETNTLLGMMINKFDMLISETAANKELNLGDAGMITLTKGINTTNFNLNYQGI